MELQGLGVTLRELLLHDAVNLQRFANNRNISRFLFDRFPHPYTLDGAVDWVTRHLDQNPQTNFVISVGGDMVGAIEFKTGEDIYRKSAMMGYWLGEPFWGQGIMTEAVKVIATYAFNNFDVVRIQASVNGNNPASCRVLEKAGFEREGIRRNAIIKDGEMMDEFIYALLKKEPI